MNIFEKEICWGLQQLILSNQRVIYWPEQRSLILSDLHMGKAAHFRKNGVPIPTQIHQQDLDRLKLLISYYDAKKVIIVGDLIHANENVEVDDFSGLIQNFKDTEFILIEGNHDRISKSKITSWGFASFEKEYILNDIKFIHEPDYSSGLQIVGHIHPGVSLRLPTNKNVRLPAFVVSPKQIILPAFSKFTGLATNLKIPDSIYYGIYEDGIVKLI